MQAADHLLLIDLLSRPHGHFKEIFNKKQSLSRWWIGRNLEEKRFCRLMAYIVDSRMNCNDGSETMVVPSSCVNCQILSYSANPQHILAPLLESDNSPP